MTTPRARAGCVTGAARLSSTRARPAALPSPGSAQPCGNAEEPVGAAWLTCFAAGLVDPVDVPAETMWARWRSATVAGDVMALYRSQMRALAEERYAEGQRLMDAHHGDATGCCADCGRPAPCPGREAGARLCEQYRPWAAPEPAAADRGHLVRPYVRGTGDRG